MKRIPVSTVDELYRAIDGRRYTYKGVECRVRVEWCEGWERIQLEPTPAGKRSWEYRTERERLRDDWSFDISHSEEAMGAVFQKFTRWVTP